MDIFTKSDYLQSQAKTILTDLTTQLANPEHYKLTPVGSYVYGLMSWEDLDIDLITLFIPTDDLLWNVVKKLFQNKNIKKLELVDNRHGDSEQNRPKSIYIGLKYELNQVVWKIDIRLVEKSEVQKQPAFMTALTDITPEHRQAILEIKSKFYTDNRYHREVSSVDIYRAVIEYGINSFEEFLAYLNKHKHS